MKHSVTEVKLKNDARGLLINVPDATVMTFAINFRAGEYLVAKKKWETPHLMEHVLLGANELIPKARAFQAEFEKNGAYCNASTGAYDIIYEAECADFEWDRILELLVIAISKPLFLADEFAAEFGNVREELTARSNNHFRHLSLALREAYGFSALTDQARLRLMKNVSLEDVKRHYASTHTTSNMRFVIAGKLPPERRRLVRRSLEAIELPEGSGRLALPPERPRRLDKPLYINNSTVENFHFYIDTFLYRRLRDPETDALGLVNNLLTGTLHSRILGSARERGLVYNISSGYSQARDSSHWWIGAQVMPSNIQALFSVIIRELSAVLDGKLDFADVAAAKQYALGRYQRGGQTVAGMAGNYSYRYFFDEVVTDYYKWPERIKAVSKNRIVAVFREMFSENVWGMGALGNAGEEFVSELHQKLRILWQ